MNEYYFFGHGERGATSFPLPDVNLPSSRPYFLCKVSLNVDGGRPGFQNASTQVLGTLGTFKILAAERLRLIKLGTRLIADYFQHTVNYTQMVIFHKMIDSETRNINQFEPYQFLMKTEL